MATSGSGHEELWGAVGDRAIGGYMAIWVIGPYRAIQGNDTRGGYGDAMGPQVLI